MLPSVPLVTATGARVAVIDWIPAVLKVTLKECVPLFEASEGKARRQARLRIAAAEIDRAHEAGVDAPARRNRRDGERIGRARGGGGRRRW